MISPLSKSADPWLAGAMDANDIMDRIRTARDHALEQEREERQRIADADTADKQGAASVRLATRQAVREALDDILGESTDPAQDG
jgi:membrane protein involved in colicin uptake